MVIKLMNGKDLYDISLTDYYEVYKMIKDVFDLESEDLKQDEECNLDFFEIFKKIIFITTNSVKFIESLKELL